MTLRVRPEARVDILDAAQWYEARETGLGLAFVDEVEAVFQRLHARPDDYPTAHRHARRALVRRFPYAVYFTREAEHTIVFAILHQRRDRRVLDQRIGGAE